MKLIWPFSKENTVLVLTGNAQRINSDLNDPLQPRAEPREDSERNTLKSRTITRIIYDSHHETLSVLSLPRTLSLRARLKIAQAELQKPQELHSATNQQPLLAKMSSHSCKDEVHTLISCAPASPHLHDALQLNGTKVCSGITPAGLAWYKVCRKLLQRMKGTGLTDGSSQRTLSGLFSRIVSRHSLSRPHETAHLLLFLYEGRARVFAFDATTHLILSRNIAHRFAGQQLQEEHEMLSWIGTILRESSVFIEQKTHLPIHITIIAAPTLLASCETLTHAPGFQRVDLLSPAKAAHDLGLQPCDDLVKLLLQVASHSRLPRVFTSMALRANFILYQARITLGLACVLIPGLLLGSWTIHQHLLEMQSRRQQIAQETQTLFIKNRTQGASLTFLRKILRNTDPRSSWQSLCHVPARLIRIWHWQWSITTPLHLPTSKVELAVSTEDELREAHEILSQYFTSTELTEPPPFLDSRLSMQSNPHKQEQKAVLTLRGDVQLSQQIRITP